jgi:hypothetical protein
MQCCKAPRKIHMTGVPRKGLLPGNPFLWKGYLMKGAPLSLGYGLTQTRLLVLRSMRCTRFETRIS